MLTDAFKRFFGLARNDSRYAAALKKIASTAIVAIVMAQVGVLMYSYCEVLSLAGSVLGICLWFYIIPPIDSMMRLLVLMLGALLTGACVASASESFSLVERELLLGLSTVAVIPILMVFLVGFILTRDNLYAYLIAVIVAGGALTVWSLLYGFHTGVTFYYLQNILIVGVQLFSLWLWDYMWKITGGRLADLDGDHVKLGANIFIAYVVFVISILAITHLQLKHF